MSCLGEAHLGDLATERMSLLVVRLGGGHHLIELAPGEEAVHTLEVRP